MRGDKTWKRLQQYNPDIQHVKPTSCGLCTSLYLPKEKDQEVCYECIKLALTVNRSVEQKKYIKPVQARKIIAESKYAFIHE